MTGAPLGDELLMSELGDKVADHIHQVWLTGHRISEEQAGRDPLAPRMRPIDDASLVNINVPWSALHPDRKKANQRMGLFAITALRAFALTSLTPEQRIEIAAAIHEFWLKENSYARGGPLDKPFAELPEAEAQKDLDVVDIALKVFSASFTHA